MEGIHVLDPLHQPHHVPGAIPAIVAGITGEHGHPVLSLSVKRLEQNNEPEHMGMREHDLILAAWEKLAFT